VSASTTDFPDPHIIAPNFKKVYVAKPRVAEEARHRLKSTPLKARNPPGFVTTEPSDSSDGAEKPFFSKLLVAHCWCPSASFLHHQS
jgi:hypothetical protein